jgi:Cu/Ag efflux protein CusF
MFKMSVFSASLIGLLMVLPHPSLAYISGAEWLTRMEKIQAAQGIPSSRHVRAQGEVDEIDARSGTISIFHPELRTPDNSIWMPAMHMVFHVTSKEMLKGLKTGDHIHFVVGRHRGAVMVTHIDKRP